MSIRSKVIAHGTFRIMRFEQKISADVIICEFLLLFFVRGIYYICNIRVIFNIKQ